MKVKFFLASIISGVLLALAWSALGGLILLIAFVPLLWLDNYFTQNKSNYVSITFWYYAFLTFLTWNILAAWWIWIVTPSGALFILITNSFLMSLVWLLVHEIRRSRGDKLANFMLILAWITFEYLHYHWDLSWPWLTLGNGFANNVKIVQWYELTGVFGGSLWVLLVNLLVWNIVKKHQYKRTNFNYTVCIRLLFVVIFPIVASATRYCLYAEEGDGVNVVVAQPNIDPYKEKFSGMKFEEQYDRILDAFDSLGSNDIDFFIAPETAFHNVWLNNTSKSIPINLSRDFINNSYPASAIVVGALTFLEYDDKEHSSSTARYSVKDSIFYDVFNSALCISGEGVQGVYHKSMLVPGIEKLPFEKYLGFIKKMIVNLGGSTGTLATYNQPVLFEHNTIKVGVPICFESTYGEYVSQFVKKGAQVLFIITNDGWWKQTPGYKQHFSYSKIMAIQHRRSIARSGNTGISAFINQRGEVVQQSKWWTKTALKGTMRKNSKLTFYSKHGDYIGRVCVFIFFLMGLSIVVGRLRKK